MKFKKEKESGVEIEGVVSYRLSGSVDGLSLRVLVGWQGDFLLYNAAL